MTLIELIRSTGKRPEQVAASIGVTLDLFERVDSGAQGLPVALATRLATALSVDVASVVAAAPRLVKSRVHARTMRALPARVGEPIAHVLLHPVQSVQLPPRVVYEPG